jgi:hypothetical protein
MIDYVVDCNIDEVNNKKTNDNDNDNANNINDIMSINNNTFFLSISDINGVKHMVECYGYMHSIEYVKYMIGMDIQIHYRNISLYINNIELIDHMRLSDYNITPNTKIKMYIKMRSGLFRI